MRINTNLGKILSAANQPISIPSPPINIGKVFGIVTTKNTPTEKQFQRAGGFKGIGTIFYLPYESSKVINEDVKLDDSFLDNCTLAKPIYSNIQDYPLIGELVTIETAYNFDSERNDAAAISYYSKILNIFNNPQLNSLNKNSGSLGKTFTENSNIKNLLSFEGDRIYQGRKGNGIRFGSTVKLRSDINEWSSIGNDGDPITIMINGYVTIDTGSSVPNVEEINKELSSIYMTSTQKLPLIPGASIVNPRVNTVLPKDYKSPQVILNSDRITLNSKKDEVLLFAKTNIELNSDNIININAGKVAHINSPSIALGTNKDGSYPTEPLLLGDQTHDLLLEIIKTLRRLAGYLGTAAVATTTGTSCIPSCNHAGTQLFKDTNNLIDKLGVIRSTNVYTI